MKILHSKHSAVSGSAILMVVVITALSAIVLAAYIGLVSRQNYSTVRSQAWNSVIPVIEAGIEDGMSHLNAHGSTNLACDGWVKVGNLYVMRRNVGENYYIVTISNYVAGASNNNPTIDARGYVDMPVQIASSSHAMLAAVGVTPPPPTSTAPSMARGIRATTGRNMLYAKGLVAKGKIDMNGNNIATDSFDSTDPLYSTAGKYDPSKRKDSGDVATNSGLTNSVNVGNADILGHVSTGPGGSVAIGANGSIGDLAWGGKSGVKPGWVKDDMNVIFPDVAVPDTKGSINSLSPTTIGGTTYTYGLGNAIYEVSSLSMSGKESMYVAGTNTVLYVKGDFGMSGQSSIILAPGARLTVYVTGAGSIGGNGVVNPGTALDFSYKGLPSSTSLSLSGNAAFTGVIYAPNADFTMNGGGSSSTTDFIGASITKTVTMNGHFNFHYDEALSKYGPSRGFVVTSWNEMTPQEVAGFSIE